MASITVTLDTRAKTSAGLYPLKLVVSNKGRTAHISLGIHIRRDEWNAARRTIVGNPNRTALNAHLLQRLTDARNALLQLVAAGAHKNATALQLRDMIEDALSPKESPPTTFGEWYGVFTRRHENKRTREIYEATWKALSRFDAGVAGKQFEEITKSYLETFFLWCGGTSPSVNARNIHLRNIRAVFNDAIDNGVTAAYPFRRLRITPVPTRKRSIDIDTLRMLMTCEVDARLQRYYDAFRLSFFLIGMNLADLCTVTPDTMQGGRLNYTRRKTKKAYSIRIEPEARNIIDIYKTRERVARFFDGENYRAFNEKLNAALPAGITAYSARHSWATVAAALDIPDDTIALALGHTPSNATTDIYIRRDLKKVDEANRKVIDYVLTK